MSGDPYCSNCGYNLQGLTESSKCPECGKPMVEVLTRKLFDPAKMGWGRRYRSNIVLRGVPLLHVALGPSQDGPKGKARGIIAIGDQARGVLAIGGSALGVVAIGGLARGFFAVGGWAIGVFSMAGWSIGLFAWGGAAVGILATGGGACGVVSTGGGAIGYYAAGGGVLGKHVLAPYRRDNEAVQMFNKLSWLLGNTTTSAIYMPGIWLSLILLLLLIGIGVLVLLAYVRHVDVGDAGGA